MQEFGNYDVGDVSAPSGRYLWRHADEDNGLCESLILPNTQGWFFSNQAR